MSSFGYNVLGFGANANSVVLPSEDEFNRVSFLSHFDGANNGVNNAFDDGSTSNHTITANGNVTQGSFGPFAREEGYWGVAFDGTGDCLTFTNDATMSLDGDYTVELFFNPTKIAGQNILTITTALQLWMHGNEKYIGWYAITDGTGGDIVKTADDAILLNVWNHIAIVRSGSGSNNTSMYYNGTRVSQAQNTATIGASSGTSFIGGYDGNSGGFNGAISNLRIIKGTALYSGSSITVPTSPLTAVTNTKLLTCQSNRFVDNSASAHTITPVADASISAFGPVLTDAVYDPAVNAASAYFDGSGDYLSTPSPGTLAASSNWCMECYFYCTGVVQSLSYRIMSANESADADAYTMFRIRAGQYEFYTDNGTSGLVGTAVFNAWTHIALTKSGTTVRGFVDGIKVWEATDNNADVITNLIMGWGYGSEYFSGYISDSRFVNGSSVYTSNFTPPTAPLTAITNTKLLLNMADGQAIDSAAQHNLTLTDDVKLSTAEAKFGDTSMLFDGSGRAYIEGSNVLDFGSGDFTVELFVNLTATGDTPILLDARNSNDVEGPMFSLAIFDSDKVFYFANNAVKITAGSALSVNTWYHIAVCRSGTSTKLFIDGTQSGSTYSDSTVYTQPNDRCVLGGYYDNADYDFDGYIDEVRISKMARYTSNFTAPAEPFADKGQ